MDTLVSQSVLADLFGVTPPRINQLVNEGVIAKDGRQYSLRECTRAYCAHLRARHPGISSPGAVSDERARLLAAQADGHELKNAATRGELIDARQVEAEWSNTLRSLRAAMIAVPSRVRQRLPGLSPAEVATIDAEIRAALTEAANDV